MSRELQSKLNYAELLQKDPEKLYMWVMNPNNEHCDTCRRMAGQIHPIKDYLKTGVFPQSDLLACGGGDNCGCELVDAGELTVRGRIPAARHGSFNLFSRITRLIRGFFGEAH